MKITVITLISKTKNICIDNCQVPFKQICFGYIFVPNLQNKVRKALLLNYFGMSTSFVRKWHETENQTTATFYNLNCTLQIAQYYLHNYRWETDDNKSVYLNLISLERMKIWYSVNVFKSTLHIDPSFFVPGHMFSRSGMNASVRFLDELKQHIGRSWNRIII